MNTHLPSMRVRRSAQHLATPKQHQKSLMWAMRLVAHACYGGGVVQSTRLIRFVVVVAATSLSSIACNQASPPPEHHEKPRSGVEETQHHSAKPQRPEKKQLKERCRARRG